jgi:hypothetical protein
MAIRPTPPRKRGTMERRRDDVERIDDMRVKATDVSGYVLLAHGADVTTAEATVDLDFPVTFTEKPVFTFGGELDKNHRALAGSYPTISAVIVNWEISGEIDGATEGRYIGASIACVTSGQAAQNIWLHYSFKGKAMRNPLSQMKELGAL